MLRVQRLLPRIPARLQRLIIRLCGGQALRRLVLRPLPADRAAGLLARRPPEPVAGATGSGARRAEPRRGRVAAEYPAGATSLPKHCRTLGCGAGYGRQRMAARGNAAGRAPRRADLRSELRRAGGRPRAGRLGRRRPPPRPLRDRRAGDLRLRDPDRLAAGAGPDRARAAALRRAGRPHARAGPPSSTSPTPSRPSTTTRCASCSGASAMPTSRRRRCYGRAAASGGGELAVETDRGTISAPLVVDALGWRRILAGDDGFQPLDAPLTRGAGGPSAGNDDDLAVWVDRRYARAGYGWSLPGRRGAADRRLLLRPALPRPRGDRPARRRPRSRAGPLPGQLDPARAAPADRGRRLLRRRLGRPVPAADRRGDQDRALLRDRRRARAPRRRRGPSSREQALAALRPAPRLPPPGLRAAAVRAAAAPEDPAAAAGAALPHLQDASG